MADLDLLLNLAIALGIGGLVGIEREHRRGEARVIAGVRTFPLISATGLLLVELNKLTGSGLPLVVGLAMVGGLAIALFYVRHTMGLTGLTTPFAMIMTFLAGALVGLSLALEAVVIGVAVTLLLVSKDRLHGVARALTEDEILSVLQFVTLAFILFPLVRAIERPLDPYGLIGPGLVIDPTNLLLIVVFVSSLSFVSFLAMRQAGPKRGIEASGAFGGLVNSEATAASLGLLAKSERSLEGPAFTGVLLATTTMFGRNLAIAAFVDPSLTIARFMLPAVVAMALAGALLARFSERRSGPVAQTIHVANPFAILPALKFALAFAAIALLAYGLRLLAGDMGIYASAIGAFVSAGAVIASTGSLGATGQIGLVVAGQVAVLACVLSAANKLWILRATNRALLARAYVPYGVMIALGLAGLVAATVLWG